MHTCPDSLQAFHAHFATEAAGRSFLFAWRWPRGFTCPRCSSSDYTWLSRRALWQCRTCRHQTSLTAGTALQHSKVPLRIWAYALWLVGRPGLRVSALQFQRDTGLRSYAAALHLLHKVRKSLQNPEKWPIDGPVERGARRLPAGAVRDPTGGPVLVVAIGAQGVARASIASRDLPRAPTAGITAFFTALGGWLAVTHRGVSPTYLPRYVDEHLYRSNRRHLGWRTFGFLARRVMSAPWARVRATEDPGTSRRSAAGASRRSTSAN